MAPVQVEDLVHNCYIPQICVPCTTSKPAPVMVCFLLLPCFSVRNGMCLLRRHDPVKEK